MSVTETYAPVREVGDGVQVDFDANFQIIQATDLSVGKILRSTGVKTDMVYGVDYTVAIDTATRLPTVTYTVAPTALQDSWIGRAVPITQTATIPTNNIFREVQVNNALDKATMVSQQLSEQIGRALLLPETSTLTDVELPEPVAGRALKWNATEDGFENTTYDPDDASTAVVDAEAAQAAAEAAATAASNYAAALTGTSVSSNSIGTGAKTFTTQSGKQWAAGQFIMAVDSANSANYIHGQVTSYSGTSLVIDSQSTGGSGTKTSWNIYVSGNRGATGASGASGVRGTFANADLTTGVLTITHNFALSSPYSVTVSVFNNSGVLIIPDQVNTLATNSVKVDLTSYGTLSGTWSYVVTG